MLCAGLREWVSAASLAGPFCSTSRAASTSYSLFVPGREIHVATDDPMMASMAGRYAAALFELAKDQRQLAEVERDLASFQKMLDDSPDLRRLVRSPVISADDQAKALAQSSPRPASPGSRQTFSSSSPGTGACLLPPT